MAKGFIIIQSEIKAVDIDSIMWPVGYSSLTLSTETDIDGDGNDEKFYFGLQGDNTLKGIIVSKDGTTVNLLNLISSDFWNAISPIMDNTGTFATDCVLEADSLDLDGDNRKEIIIAAGDNNTLLAVSVLKYVGGSNLYQEVGGFVGHRLLFITVVSTLYVPYGSSVNGKYVEFGYDGQQFGMVGYNMD